MSSKAPPAKQTILTRQRCGCKTDLHKTYIKHIDIHTESCTRLLTRPAAAAAAAAWYKVQSAPDTAGAALSGAELPPPPSSPALSVLYHVPHPLAYVLRNEPGYTRYSPADLACQTGRAGKTDQATHRDGQSTLRYALHSSLSVHG